MEMVKKAFRSVQMRAGIIGALLSFLARNKMLWLVPMIIILLLFFMILLLGSSTPLGPFIYTIF